MMPKISRGNSMTWIHHLDSTTIWEKMWGGTGFPFASWPFANPSKMVFFVGGDQLIDGDFHFEVSEIPCLFRGFIMINITL